MLLSGHDGSDANETNANEKRASMCPPRCENRRCGPKLFDVTADNPPRYCGIAVKRSRSNWRVSYWFWVIPMNTVLQHRRVTDPLDAPWRKPADGC